MLAKNVQFEIVYFCLKFNKRDDIKTQIAVGEAYE